MRSGTRSDRKAREVARSPACGLAVSLRGRGSISKGDLFWIGSRADMPRHRHIIYNKSKQINAPTQDYFPISENYAAIRDLTAGWTRLPARGRVMIRDRRLCRLCRIADQTDLRI